MNKKYVNLITILLVTSVLTACTDKGEWTYINGEKLKTSLISTGYYFDKASLSEVQIKDTVERIKTIEKPNNLGTVVFDKKIEDIEVFASTPSEVTEKDLEAKIESIRDDYMEEKIVTTKRAAELGDKVIMNFDGKINGIDFQGGKATDEEIILGDGSILPDFENGIVGKKAGTNFTVEVNFPEDYEEPSLRGKKAEFTCLIKYIKEKVTPEFDDEFAKAHSKTGAKNIEEYKEEIRKDLEFVNEYAVKEDMRNQLFNEIYGMTKSTPSEEGLAWEFTKMITEQKRLADLRDVSYEEQMTNGYYALGDVLFSYKMQAPQMIVEAMILDELSKRYNVTYTDEDKMQWFRDLCVYQDYGDDVTYELYSNSMGEPYIYDNGRKAKVMDEVLKHVKIKHGNKNEEEN